MAALLMTAQNDRNFQKMKIFNVSFILNEMTADV